MFVWCLDPTSGSCKIPGTCFDRLPVGAWAAHKGPVWVSGGSECHLSPCGDATPELGSHLWKPSSPHSNWEVWPKLLVTTGRRHSTKGDIPGVLSLSSVSLLLFMVIIAAPLQTSHSNEEHDTPGHHPFLCLFSSLLPKLTLGLSFTISDLLPPHGGGSSGRVNDLEHMSYLELLSTPGIPTCSFTIHIKKEWWLNLHLDKLKK